jgi:hypothetical protein
VLNGKTQFVVDLIWSFFADYSVLVENVPGNATKVDEWIDFFKSLSPLDEQGGKVADVTIALNNGDLFRNIFFIDCGLSSLITVRSNI